MKAIIYTGIGLISAAAVYGMADYYGSNNNGSLKQLYKENETVITEKPVRQLKAGDVAALSLNKEAAVTETLPVSSSNKTMKKKRPTIRFEEFSRSALVPLEEVPDIPVTMEPVQIQPEVKPAVIEKEPEAARVIKRSEKRIDLRMFSRAKPERTVTISEAKKE